MDGDYDGAIVAFEKFLLDYADPTEAYYGLAMAYSLRGQAGDIDTAMGYVEDAVDAGLPFKRFLVGPRNLLEPLTSSTQFQEYAEQFSAELLQGPMLGCVTDANARFWVRTLLEVPVQIRASKSEQMTNPVTSAAVITDANNDYTAIAVITGLDPNTEYFYQVVADGNLVDVNITSFRTFPPKGTAAKFKVGFGGGAGYTPENERMWNTINAHNLRAFLLLGDNAYIDDPTKPDVQRYCYYRRHCRPEFRVVTASAPIFAIWDDHDFGTNDCAGGPDVNDPTWKRAVWNIFKENWNNPYYGGGESQPGCWFDFSIGDVDFFMLDSRYYKDYGSSPTSMLGPVQKQWLLDKLGASTATFKVIASPVPWSFCTKPGSLDPWDGFPVEREEIFSFIRQNQIEGVVLLSADRHRSDAWLIEEPNGYNFYEFESSKLTNAHAHDTMPRAIFSYNEKCSFGLLSFDSTKTEPEVTYDVVSIDGETVHTLTVWKSQLSFPTDIVDSEDLKQLTDAWLDSSYAIYAEEPAACIAHWKLDEADPNTIAHDSSTNHYDGTLGNEPNKPVWNPGGGRFGGALYFNPDSGYDYVAFGTEPGSADALSVAFWVKMDTPEDLGSRPKEFAIGKYDNDASGRGWAVMMRPYGSLRFFIGSRQNRTRVDSCSCRAYELESWFHIACTFDDGTVQIWSNGELIETRSGIAQTVNNINTPLYLGTTYGQRPGPLHGFLDDVYIFDYVLSREEIMYLADVSELHFPLSSPPDLCEDGHIDFWDFAILAGKWLEVW